jgi:hypothetical protein
LQDRQETNQSVIVHDLVKHSGFHPFPLQLGLVLQLSQGVTWGNLDCQVASSFHGEFFTYNGLVMLRTVMLLSFDFTYFTPYDGGICKSQ